MNRRFPRLSADDLFPLDDLSPRRFFPLPSPHVIDAPPLAGLPRYLCRECGETLGVCSCFRPVRLEP